MRQRWELCWNAFGTAEVFAESEKDALEIVSEGCFDFRNIDFEDNKVDGVEVRPA